MKIAENKKGFTLVEVIVVLVILAILASIIIPSMTGWIDKAKESRLIVACRTCVTAAQTLVSEAYGVSGTATPPAAADVVALAGVPGAVSGIAVDDASHVINSLTYTEGGESVTYLRLPSPHYVSDAGISEIMAAVAGWAQNAVLPAGKANENLTIDYGRTNPEPLTTEQMEYIFGDLKPVKPTQYIYPMAIRDTNGQLLNIQYVTPQNPSASGVSGQNRYQASAFIIDGQTYICTLKTGDAVRAIVNATNQPVTSFQTVMNSMSFASTQDFVNFITTNGGYYQLAGQ